MVEEVVIHSPWLVAGFIAVMGGSSVAFLGMAVRFAWQEARREQGVRWRRRAREQPIVGIVGLAAFGMIGCYVTYDIGRNNGVVSARFEQDAVILRQVWRRDVVRYDAVDSIHTGEYRGRRRDVVEALVWAGGRRYRAFDRPHSGGRDRIGRFVVRLSARTGKTPVKTTARGGRSGS